MDLVGQLDPSTGVYSQNSSSDSAPVTTSTIAATVALASTRPRAMDIFSTALASANINLDNFMEEEDGDCLCRARPVMIPHKSHDRIFFVQFQNLNTC